MKVVQIEAGRKSDSYMLTEVSKYDNGKETKKKQILVRYMKRAILQPISMREVRLSNTVVTKTDIHDNKQEQQTKFFYSGNSFLF